MVTMAFPLRLGVIFVLVMKIAFMDLSSTAPGSERDEHMITRREIVEDDHPNVMDRILTINKGLKRKWRMYQGDIKLAKIDKKMMKAEEKTRQPLVKRGQIRNRRFIWRTRVIYYTISKKLKRDARRAIYGAMREIRRLSCIKFKRKKRWQKKMKYYLRFVKRAGCWSFVGRKYKSKKGQKLSVGEGCEYKSIVLHELVHALGFWHEQSRPDRDKYIKILWENIKKKKAKNFRKLTYWEVDDFSPYDVDSMMHYSLYTFSKNDKPTIQIIKTPWRDIGEKEKLTRTDVMQINALYNCKVKGGGWSKWSNYSPCDQKCRRTKERFCMSKDIADCPGANTYGVQSFYAKCRDDQCNTPVDGHWGKWNSWTWCKPYRERRIYGRRSRRRKCNNPKPRFGGKKCKGRRKRYRRCRLEVLPRTLDFDGLVETRGGTAEHEPCFFPFQYEGVMYRGCIDKHSWARKYWCGTTPNVDEDNAWGYCVLKRRRRRRRRRF
uniref:Metalloendopeptidase n=1 Tax=Isarachnanthus nocturnus TaxID=1240238 RepID=A0A7G7WYR9_9CNID|nr:toxin candidate TRINITY_DN10262_c0_g2_i1 [Isarachnanthus nocturnus]